MKFFNECFKFNFKALFYFAAIIFSLSVDVETHENIFDITDKFRNNKVRRCSHEKKSYKKHYFNNFNKYSRKSFSSYYNEIPFEKMRIHFDYSLTLPHEERILKELVIPPVKNFYENTLSVRRIPGKLRIPKNLDECQGIPFPSQIRKDGVDADLLIIITTYRGLKKYKYEQLIDKHSNNNNNHNKQSKDMLKSFLNDFFDKRAKVNSSLKKDQMALKSMRVVFPETSNNDTISNESVDEDDKSKLNLTNISNDPKNNASKPFHSSNKTVNHSIEENLLPWEINDGPSDIVGWSSSCLQDLYTLRPVLGVMQFVADIDPSPRAIEEAVWTTLHEFAHILGMDYDLYSDFIDSEMNRKGYEGTLRIKSKLKGLEELMLNRSEYFDDLQLFATDGGKEVNSNRTNLTHKSKDLVDKKGYNYMKFKQLDENSVFESRSIKEDNSEKAERLNYRKKANSVITISNHNENQIENRNEDLIHLKKRDKKINSNSSKNNRKFKNNTIKPYDNQTHSANKSSYNLNEDPVTDYVSNFSSYSSNHTYHVIDNSSFNLGMADLPSVIEFEYNISQISLPLLNEFVEVNFPPNINITTLLLYISNFSENTKVYIKTQNVVTVGKSHFNCENLDGVELEHFGGLGSAYSHWSKRILNTEFMIADSYGENYLSNFTLALFEDSGWYKVDYSKSEDILWGKNKGCAFLNEKCIFKKKEKKSFFTRTRSDKEADRYENTINIYETNFKDEFCLSKEEEKCSISKVFRAFCSLEKGFFTKVPKQYQYFDDPEVSGGNYFGDYCPYPIEWTDDLTFKPIGSCRNGISLRKELGEKICENCRCFVSSLIDENVYEKQLKKIENFNKNHKKNSNHSISNHFENLNLGILSKKSLDNNRAMCYEAKCRKEGKKVFLIISIDTQEIKCPRNGGTLSIEGYKGFIECPPVNSVCLGSLDPNLDYTNTSAYNLFSHLAEKLLNLIYDFISSIYDKKEYIES